MDTIFAEMTLAKLQNGREAACRETFQANMQAKIRTALCGVEDPLISPRIYRLFPGRVGSAPESGCTLGRIAIS